MRILLLTHHLNLGGIETHVSTLAGQLLSSGHTVAIASEGGVLANSLVMQGARHYQLPLGCRARADIEQCADQLTQILRAEKIDVLHIHHFMPLVVGVTAASAAGCPWLFTCHGIPSAVGWIWYFGPWHYTFTRSALLEAGARISVSRNIADHLSSEYDLEPASIDVVKNGLILDDFPFSRRVHDQSNQQLRLIYISRLDSDKRPCVLGALALMRELLGRGLAVDLTFVGDGDARMEFEAIAADAARASSYAHVAFTGARTDIAAMISDHDAVLGVGRVALEAMASRRPAVLTGVQGLVDVVDGENFGELEYSNFSGWNCEQRSPADVADRLLTILTNAAGLDRHTAEMRTIIERNYEQRRVGEQILAFYDRARRRGVPADRFCRWRGALHSEAASNGGFVRSNGNAPRSPAVSSTVNAQNHLKAGRLIEAELELRSALREIPNEEGNSEALGRLLFESGRPECALSVIEPAVAAHPNHVVLRFLHAQILSALGRYADARTTLDEAIRYQPANPNLIGARFGCDLAERERAVDDLRAEVEEMGAYTRRLRGDIAERDAIIRDLKAKAGAWSTLLTSTKRLLRKFLSA